MTTEEQTSVAGRLGFQPGQIVQEIGYDDDTDQELREAVEEITGQDLVDETYDDVAGAVLVWFRDNDGDLADALVDAIGMLEDGGDIWLLTQKTGRDGYIEPRTINEATRAAGLPQAESISVAKDWIGTRLIAPQKPR
ncbi:DUF3052 domain-containing protein [Streptomyces sp. NBC_00249]|uniref:DUF3052 domain-containing protein n=1 Tax=Streptomyces sp. NBC_00249 TaxID=2975690 RepID=UPI00225A881C|nr:DUF3052 domain-containing protein [Streptomyces sp. NBC_00249]MCX5199827.1 DUF3052 domain-containing protein [Streptomyces sp. NBC_00249]